MRDALEKFYRFVEEPIRLGSRPILVLLVLPLILAFTAPLWNISMKAPQYPQGLSLDIYAHKVEGGNSGNDIQEINTLNHYIGMAPLNRAALADLDWIPFALGVLFILTLRVAAVGNVRALIDLSVMTLYFSLFSLARFVYKLYTLGHDLDPKAPMTIEPFMPAVFGTKQIANFTVTSMPRAASVYMAIFALGVAALTIWHLVVGRIESRRAAESAAQSRSSRAIGVFARADVSAPEPAQDDLEGEPLTWSRFSWKIVINYSLMRRQMKSRPRNLPADQRRAATVEAVIELAAAHNPGDITTAAIAGRMNLTQGALFRHFASKEAVWEAVMEWVAERLLARVDRATRDVASPLAALEAAFLAHVEFVVLYPGVPRMLFGELQRAEDTAAKRKVRQLLAQYGERLAGLVEAGKAAGELTAEVGTDAAVAHFIGTVQGLVMQSLLAGDPERMRSGAPIAFAIYRRGIAGAR